MKHGILFLLCMGLSLLCTAQKFYTEVNASSIEMGDNLKVKFVWENIQGSNFEPPPMLDFQILQGPTSSRRSHTYNGRTTSSRSFSYIVTPTKPGRHEIGPATLTANGKKIYSQPVIITVKKGATSDVPIDSQVFIKASLSDSIILIGQQIILDYKIYSLSGKYSNINFKTSPTFDGFYARTLPLGRKNYTTEIVNGEEYYVQTFTRVAMFPQQTGTYEIEPVTLVFNVEVLTDRGKRTITKNANVSKQIVQVQEMPSTTEPQTGAVGKYGMRASSTQRRITTDKAIVVNMNISGNGDPNQIKPPLWNLPDGLEMYDPNVTEGEPKVRENQLTHSKSFEYLIVAKEPGNYELKPSFTYYDTDSLRYITLTQPMQRVTVTQGDNLAEVAESQEKREMSAIYETTQFREQPAAWHHSALHLGSFLTLLLGSLSIFMMGRAREKSGKYDADQIRRDAAYGVAQSRLQTAKTHMDQGDSKAFHEEMITGLKSYLTDKYKIPALHLKKEELLDQMSSHVNEEMISDFNTLTSRSEMAMYAPVSVANMEETYELASSFITRCERINSEG